VVVAIDPRASKPYDIAVKGLHWFILQLALAVSVAAADLPPIQSVTSDDQGRIIVNGRPFFPILMYGVPAEPAPLNMIRDHGFNTVTGKPEDTDVVLANGLYAAVHAGGKKVEKLGGVLLGIGVDSPALIWKQGLLEKVKANLAKVRSEIPNRPIMNAIGYWDDEPAGVVANTLLPKERYEDLIKILDVTAPYLYPVPYEPIRSVGAAVERAYTATEGKKPLLPILQLFVWNAKDRYPTPAELKCMVYLALIHGANGIGYYSYNYVDGKTGTNIAKEQPELWQAVKEINGEIAAISPLLLAGGKDSTKLKEGAPDVEFRTVSHDKSTLILLANTANAPKTAVLQFAARIHHSLKSIGEGKTLSFDGDQVKIPLQPNQAAAWIE